jgi:hypothetical protein
MDFLRCQIESLSLQTTKQKLVPKTFQSRRYRLDKWGEEKEDINYHEETGTSRQPIKQDNQKFSTINQEEEKTPLVVMTQPA